MKKFKYTIILILLIPLLTSCWSRKELNELAITTGLAIDKQDDNYLITAQVLNPSEIATSQQTSSRLPIVTFTRTGQTIFEALRNLTHESPRRLYLSHVRMVILGEEVALEGIQEVLDFISRDHEMRTDFYIAVAKGQEGREVLKVLSPLEKIPTMRMFNSIETASKNIATVKGVHLDELITKIITKGINPVLTGIYVKGPKDIGNDIANVEKIDPPTSMQTDYLAAFKEDKLVGWLTKDESKGLKYIENDVTNTIITIPCEDGKLSIELYNVSSSVEGSVSNGSPKVKIKLRSEGIIGEVQCKLDLTKPETLEELNKKIEENQKEKIQEVVDRAQKDLKSDILSFGSAIHRADPKGWKSLSEKWDEEFPTVEVEYDIKADIRRLGTISESFQK